jgi:hypothetical protein
MFNAASVSSPGGGRDRFWNRQLDVYRMSGRRSHVDSYAHSSDVIRHYNALFFKAEKTLERQSSTANGSE